MSTGFVITVSILSGLLLLFGVLGLVYALVRKKLSKLVANKFNREDILGVTTRANFFGVKSKGGSQIRGNGALVLTEKTLHFIRAVPQKEYKIPISSIRRISMPKFFNGKSAWVPILCVHYETETGEDSIGWAVAGGEKWKEAIEKMITADN